jgi:tripartite-type tricarboxylate transporter receptor subunit TctC
VAWSQAYPVKPVRVIIPFPPGGGNDIVARIVFPKVSEQMGQSFVIENRAGAGGTVGSTAVAQSKPDGYTLLIQTVGSHVSNPHLYSKLPYDALRDFVGIATIARVVMVLSVHPSMPTLSVKEFIALAQKRPKEISFAHAGFGSFGHLNTVILESTTGIQITQVPYKGGGPAVISLISGETQAIFQGVGEIIEHLKANRARPLGVSSAERVAQLPHVPTMAESFPGYETTTWFTVLAPAGTPKAIVDRLNAEIGNALRDPGIASRLSAVAFDPVHRTPDDLAQRLKADHEMVGKLFRQLGVKLD